MNAKIKILLIATIFMVSVVLSGCVDNSVDEETPDADQITEKANPIQEKKDDTEKNKRIVPEEVEKVQDENPEQTAPVEKKVISVSSSGSSGGSSGSKSSEPATKTITITDDTGREITVPYPCERTVFLVENAMNSMYAIGGADSISGIGAVWYEDTKAPFFTAIDPKYDEKRLSEGNAEPTLEKIAEADPQLVIKYKYYDDTAKAIEETLNVPVYLVNPMSFEDVENHMETFSKLIDNEKRGDEAVRIMEEAVEKVTDETESIPEDDKPTVFWLWNSAYKTAGLGSPINELIEKAGGVNVISQWDNETRNTKSPTVNLETLLALDPDVIYLWTNEKLDPQDIIDGKTVDGTNYADWKELTAVKNGRVYEISDPFVYDIYCPRAALALMYVAKDLHPDRFADMDLAEETDQYYVDIYGVHYPGYGPTRITVKDDIGREITVPYPCERTVFLVENAMNSMYAIGGADSIVGIGAVWFEDTKAPFFRAIDPDYDDKRLSEGKAQPNIETIASVEPELVLLWAADWEDENMKAIEETLNVPVYGVFIDSLDDLQRQMETFSRFIGKQEHGEEVLDIMDENMKKVTDVTGPLSAEEKPTVYWMWGDVYGTAGLESTANDLIERAGGTNVLNKWDDETKNLEHPELNLETLLDLNPEVIYMWNNENLDPEDILSNETVTVGEITMNFADWQEIEAVKNGRVYEVSDPFVYDFHSPRLPLAMMHIAKDLHPDRFADLNLTEETDQFYVDVYGVHYPGFEPASET